MDLNIDDIHIVEIYDEAVMYYHDPLRIKLGVEFAMRDYNQA